MRLPCGTITFLFTDIDGSTRFWEANPEAMSVALRRHDDLLRATVERFGGKVFKTVGDAFHVAFEDATYALEAAKAAQAGLLREAWPEETPIRVRMVLHSGEAELRDSDYFGRTLNRTARLLSAGHGGQILASHSTRELIRDPMPDGIDLLDLGEHRIRDLSDAERLYQVLHPALPEHFDPVRTLDSVKVPNNLPQPATSFVGRTVEMAEIQDLLMRSRLLTLVGAGGCGKTRLSLEVGQTMLEDFRDGIWFVALAPVADPGSVASATASALQIMEAPGERATETIANALKYKRAMIVFDNCEHVLSGVAELLERLYQACPHVRFLCTSREAVNIPGERAYRVPSLGLPPGEVLNPWELERHEAVRLFLDRAYVSRPDLDVTDETRRTAASICVRLDGIPLAIELAAARTRSLSVREIHERLDNVFALLTGGSRSGMPRQRTLHALIDWSYALLSEPERIVFRTLAAFSGGWSLEAAEQVCECANLPDRESVLDLLTALVDKSLVTVSEEAGVTRYGMLATIRQFALECLQRGGEAETAYTCHLNCYRSLARDGYAKTRGTNAVRWMDIFEQEHDNLRSAIGRCLSAGDIGAALELTGELGWFWYSRGHVTEGRQLLARALQIPGGERSPYRLRALYSAFWLAHSVDDTCAAQGLAEELAIRARQQGNAYFSALAANGRGILARFHLEDYASARAFFEEALDISRTLPDGGNSRAMLTNLASTVMCLGDYARARELLDEALEIAHRSGEPEGIAICTFELATVCFEVMEYELARSHFESALRLMRGAGLKARELDALNWSSMMALDIGDYREAISGFQMALALGQETRSDYRTAWSNAGLARCLAETGESIVAREHLAKALSYYQRRNDAFGISECLYAMCALSDGPKAATFLAAAWKFRSHHPQAVSPNDRRRFSLYANRLRTRLGEAAYHEGFAVGDEANYPDLILALLG